MQMDLDVAVVDEGALGASLDVCDAATGPRVGARPASTVSSSASS